MKIKMWNVTILLLLFLYIQSYQTIRIKPRCYSDFDFHKVSNHSKTIYEKSWKRDCSADVRKVCEKNVTIAYFAMKPYTTKQIFTKTRWPENGLLQQILSIALAQCCGNCISIHFNRVDSRETLVDMKTKESNDILFPIFSQGRLHQLNASLPLLTTPIIHLPGAMFITKSVLSAKIFAREVVTAVVDIWPLFGVSLLLAFAAGVLCWIMDTWWNKEHFPRTFFSGAFEGFWWAFVSMTTVGYGDRAPKSIPGRLFACFWILCGITIIALMTAALTTAIASVAKRQQASINHGKIGILKNHPFEKNMLLRGNAEKVSKNDVNELLQSLLDNEINAILIDSLSAKASFGASVLDENGLYLESVIQDLDQSYLGVTIYDDELHSLINEYLEFQQEAINDFISNVIHNFDDIRNDKVIANLIFTTDSGLFYPTVYTCIIILVITLIIGGAYETFRYVKNKKSKSQHKSEFVITMKSLKQKESEFQSELEVLLKTWEKYLLERMRGYSIRGVFTKTNRTYPNILIKLTPNDLDSLAMPNDDDFDQKKSGNKKNKKQKQKKKMQKTKYSAFDNDDDDNDDDDDVEEMEEESEDEKPVKKKSNVPKKKKKVKRTQTAPSEQNDETEDEKPVKKSKKKTSKSPVDSENDIELKTKKTSSIKKSKKRNDEEV